MSAAAAVIGVSGKQEAALQPTAYTTAESRHAASQLQMHDSSASQPIVTQRRSTDSGTEAPRVLCIGLGGGSLPNFLSHHFPGLHVDAVELDPLVVRAASDHMGLPQHRCLAPLWPWLMPFCHQKLSGLGTLQLDCGHPADFLLPWDACKPGSSKAFTGLSAALISCGLICISAGARTATYFAGCQAKMICCSGQTCNCIRAMLLTMC